MGDFLLLGGVGLGLWFLLRSPLVNPFEVLSKQGVVYARTKTRDSGATGFPVDVYTGLVAGSAPGVIWVLAVASDDPSSWVIWTTDAAKTNVRLFQKGTGSLTGQIARGV